MDGKCSILDATCGGRMFWQHATPSNVLCLDARVSVHPDIVARDEYLPFRNSSFNVIYFDPPHNHGPGGFFKERYGGFGSYDDLRQLYHHACQEFARVLETSGYLFVKLTRTAQLRGSKHHEGLLESQMPYRFSQYASVAGFTLERMRHTPSRGSSRNAHVYWMRFRKVGNAL